ncbi:MAG TPA: HIT family protein [Bacteroidetes bacterium]|nr:HIT family protein [Bacteroidota bacterium]
MTFACFFDKFDSPNLQNNSADMPDCVFCDIASRKRPAEILFENDDAICILDINPIHYGHSLVIPKRHCRDFLDVPSGTLGGVMEAARTVARALVQSLNLEGYNIFTNNGAIAGQSVFHFHLHITPRYKNDNITFVLTLKQYHNGEMAEYAHRIRKNLGTPD